MIFQAGENINLAQVVFRKNGNPDNSANVTVTIIDCLNGSILINSAQCTNQSNGIYTYQWVNGILSDSTFLAVFKNGNYSGGDLLSGFYFRIVTTKQDLIETIDLDDGRAF